jgi:hypothetical protein
MTRITRSSARAQHRPAVPVDMIPSLCESLQLRYKPAEWPMYYRLAHQIARVLHGLFAVSLILKFSEVPSVSWPVVFCLLCASASVQLLDYTFARMTVRQSDGGEGDNGGSRWEFLTHDNLLCAAYVPWVWGQSVATALCLGSEAASWAWVFGPWVLSLLLNMGWHVADVQSARQDRFRRRVQQQMACVNNNTRISA